MTGLRTLTTKQVAKDLGVPYSTVLKWQSIDHLLHPILGLGGRRGGDRWPVSEVRIATVVARLRAVGLPIDVVRPIVEALRQGPESADAEPRVVIMAQPGVGIGPVAELDLLGGPDLNANRSTHPQR